VLEAGAVDSGESHWGFNGGAGVEIGVAPNVSIVGELRVHGFPSQAFVWTSSEDPASPIDESLLEQLLGLPPSQVELVYFQATGGVAFRF
jgi:hypothetical protein